MNLTLRISFGFLLFASVALGQEEQVFEADSKSDKNETKTQKLGAFGVNLVHPITVGDGFMGLAMEGKSSFNFTGQFFVYKSFYVVGAIGNDFFNVTNKEIVGNYNKTSVDYSFLAVGYEIIHTKKLKIGGDLALFGDSNFKNKGLDDNKEFSQTDTGKVRCYRMYADYMLSNIFALSLSYAYRNDKMSIRVPDDVQSTFKNASYHNVSIGVKLYFGNKDIISGI